MYNVWIVHMRCKVIYIICVNVCCVRGAHWWLPLVPLPHVLNTNNRRKKTKQKQKKTRWIYNDVLNGSHTEPLHNNISVTSPTGWTVLFVRLSVNFSPQAIPPGLGHAQKYFVVRPPTFDALARRFLQPSPSYVLSHALSLSLTSTSEKNKHSVIKN